MMGRISWMKSAVNTTRSGATGDFYDPNAGLAPETRDWAARLSLFPFENAKVHPEGIEHDGAGQYGFIFGHAGDTGHLVYVRVTVGDEQEEGTGPVPGILIDLARELNAEPHVVRVHMRAESNGTAVEYFGHDELEQALKESDHWRRRLLAGRSAREYLRRAGGRVSRLEIILHHHPPGHPPPPVPMPEELRALLQESDRVPQPEAPTSRFPGSVHFELRVERLGAELRKRSFSIYALLQSVAKDDEHFIFTCSCGSPGCAGIWRGIETVHEDDLTVWRLRGLRPRRLVVFDQAQYRQEILTKAREALALHKQMGAQARLGIQSDGREQVERALYEVEQSL